MLCSAEHYCSRETEQLQANSRVGRIGPRTANSDDSWGTHPGVGLREAKCFPDPHRTEPAAPPVEAIAILVCVRELGRLTRLALITRIAGHSSVTISQRYVHPTPESPERAFDQLTASFSAM